MELVTEEEVDILRAIADRVRAQGVVVGYGYFPGGDPRDFTPDAEACSEGQMTAHARACALLESGEVQYVDGNHHFPILDSDGNVIGHSTQAPFGIGTYSITDPEAQSLARRLDDWVDEVRRVEDMYR